MSQTFSPEILDRRLDELDASSQTPLLCAVSGGADSLALAHALHRLGRPLRLVHVDHQLCTQSADWAHYVERLAREWGVPAITVKVRVDGDANVEARARAARYTAFADVAQPGECLLTAHHLEDQAMTLLLQLLRAAGPAGLAAMPARRRVDTLVHLRPLLAVTEAALADYCRRHALVPVRDPGNDDPRFDRNYLEGSVAPLLAARWPRFARTLARSAERCADADAMLVDLARLDTASDLTADALDLTRLHGEDPRRTRNALRAWLRVRRLVVPGGARLTEFARQLHAAGSDAAPRLDLGAHVLRAYRGVVYDTVEAAPVNGWCAQLHSDTPLDLPGDAGTLSFSSPAHDPVRLQVRFRQGGERFGRSPSRSLKTFLQTLRVLPWRRGQVPLVYCGDELVAVGDWWRSRRLAGDLAWRRPVRFRSETDVSLRNRSPQS